MSEYAGTLGITHGGTAGTEHAAALAPYDVLGTPPEASFDRITGLVARCLGAPVALITFIDGDRQFFKSAFGLPEPVATERETPLAYSFCRYVVAGEAPLVVNDAREHPFGRDHLGVRDLGIASYLGTPIRTAAGEVLGSLCAVDGQPRVWTDEDQLTLEHLAGVAASELELRLKVRQLEASERERAAERALAEASLDALTDLFFIVGADKKLLRWNRRLGEVTGYSDRTLSRLQVMTLFGEDDARRVEEALGRVLEEGQAVVEAVLVTNEGRRIPYEFNGKPLRDADGRVVGVCGTGRDLTDRLEAQRALRTSEERFRSFLEATTQVVWTADEAGFITELSSTWSSFTGQTEDEVAGWGWADALHPDDQAGIAAEWSERIASMTPYASEYRVRRHDGVYHWFSVRAVPVLDEEGTLIEWVGTCADVDEQKRAEAALRESYRFARSTINALRAHIAVLDERGTIVATNEAWDRFGEENGVSADAAGVGANYLAACSSDDTGRFVADGIRAVMAGEDASFSAEYACHSPEEERWFCVRVSRFQEEGPLRIVVAHENITTRKLAEASERQLRTRYETLTEQAIVGVYIVQDGRLAYVNPHFAEMLGYAPEELMALREVSELVHERDRNVVLGHLEQHVAGVVEEARYAFRARRKDGRIIHVQSHGRRFTYGDRPAILGMLLDETERKENEARLLQREALLETSARIAQILTSKPDTAAGIEATLSLLGEATHADRVYLFENHADGTDAGGRLLTSQRYEWCRDGIEPQIGNPDLQNQAVDDLLGWAEELFAGEPVAALVRDLPAPVRAHMEAQSIRSLLAVPIIVENEWIGVIGLDDCHTERVWSAAKRAVLATIANTIGGFMHRQRFEEERTVHMGAVAASEQRFRSLVEATALVVWRADVNGLITELGDAWERLTGQTAEELAGWGWTRMLHPDDLEQVAAEWLQQIAAGRSYECEYRVRCADGVYRWVVCRAVPVFDEAGTLLEWVGTCTNIDERKRATAALAESEARFRTLAEAMPQLVWTATPEGMVDYYNDRIDTFAGVEQQVDGTWTWNLVLHDEDRARTAEAWERALRTGAPYEVEHRALLKDGTYRWFLSRGLPVRNAEGEIARWYGTATDIHDQKLAQEEMRHAKEEAEEMSRLKSSFLANMSHEIRTPLTTIIGFADLLADEVPEGPRDMVGLIQSGGHRLLDTLNSVLDLAKLESGVMELRPVRLDVGLAVREVTEMFSLQARTKGLTLEQHTPAGPAWAEADAGALQRVLMNLVGNAIKFTGAGGVTVRVKPSRRGGTGAEHDEVVVSVEDTGIGMEEAFLSKVFDEFQQESSGLTREHEGSGLGLAIVKRLVDLMGGRIEVESRKGVGSTFRFSLPAPRVSTSETVDTDGVRAEGAQAEGDPEASHARQARALVVEDRAEARMLMSVMLGAEWHVEAVGTADEALARAERMPYDIVLLDVNLGGGRSGLDVLGALRELPSYGRVPVLAVTAQALAGDRERLLAAGFDGYVSKPFTKHHLLEALRSVASGRQEA